LSLIVLLEKNPLARSVTQRRELGQERGNHRVRRAAVEIVTRLGSGAAVTGTSPPGALLPVFQVAPGGHGLAHRDDGFEGADMLFQLTL
jgi:hypothetical protein